MAFDREQGLAALTKYNHEPFHLLHALTVEKVMRWFGESLLIASLCTILIALLASLSNASVLSDNAVFEFGPFFMNYVSMIQNLFWIIGLCSFGIGSCMIFISSDGFLELLDAAKYNSAY